MSFLRSWWITKMRTIFGRGGIELHLSKKPSKTAFASCSLVTSGRESSGREMWILRHIWWCINACPLYIHLLMARTGALIRECEYASSHKAWTAWTSSLLTRLNVVFHLRQRGIVQKKKFIGRISGPVRWTVLNYVIPVLWCISEAKRCKKATLRLLVPQLVHHSHPLSMAFKLIVQRFAFTSFDDSEPLWNFHDVPLVRSI